MLKNKWFLLSIIALILVINNWSLPLWDQDEAAYAGFAKTMNESGEYVIPDYYFSHDHRKTPLHFWDIAISYKIFGINEFAVRFPSFLAIFGTFLLAFFQGKKIIGDDSASNGIIMLGSSILVTALAKVSVTDATLLFFSTLSAFGIINTLLTPSKKWVFLFWLGFGMGILTKGPPIIIFAGIFVLMLFILHEKRMNLLKLHPWFFLPLAIAPAIYWGYLTTLQDNGDFLNWMYDWYVKKRVNGSVYDQEGVFGTHILLIAGFFLLSIMYFFNAFGNAIKGIIKKENKYLILGSWFIAGWFLYEFSPSKLPAYVIVAHVPIALLMGDFRASKILTNDRPKNYFTIIHFGLNFFFALGLIIAPWFLPLNLVLQISLTSIGSLYFVSLIWQLIKFKSSDFYNIQSYTNLFLILCLWGISPLFAEHINSSARVSEYVLAHADSKTTIIICHAPGHQPSLPFYLSSQNNEIIIQENIELLQNYFTEHSNLAIITSKEQMELLVTWYPNWQFEIISTRIIDRHDLAEYYICIRP